MPLESIVVCIDNSEYCRNGDFIPNRMVALKEAAQLIATVKMNQNAQSSVGLLSMAGTRVEVHLTPTSKVGSFYQSLNLVKIQGDCDFLRALQTAQLALKHRNDKNQKQRIACLIASPLRAVDEAAMENVGRQLKKNSVSIDIISIGEVDANRKILQSLFSIVNNDGTSHLLESSATNGYQLTELIRTSDIVRDPDAPGLPPSNDVADRLGNDFSGMDPNIDPELYYAIRMSLLDEEARVRQANQGENEEPVLEEEMDHELRVALEMSMTDYAPRTEVAEESTVNETGRVEENKNAESTQQTVSTTTAVEELLRNLPGVDPSDQRLQAALNEARQSANKDADSSEKNTNP